MTGPRSDVLAWIGSDVVDADGQKIGTVEDVYLDNDTGEPEWLAVKTGLFGSRQSFVPLRGASASDRGIQVPYGKEAVKGAPQVDPDGDLDPAEEDRLYRHYESPGLAAGADGDRDGDGADDGVVQREPVPVSPVGGTEGPDAGAGAAEQAPSAVPVPMPATEPTPPPFDVEQVEGTDAPRRDEPVGEGGERRRRVRRYVIERVVVEDDI